MLIREATAADYSQLWKLYQQIIFSCDAYMHDEHTTYDEWQQYWFPLSGKTFVAEADGVIAGSYVIKQNQPGRGNHIANGSYMVSPMYRGKSIGKMLGEHSIVIATLENYKAIQFNAVVKTNEHAVRLWLKLGFKIIGEVPAAFRHKTLGLVNTYIMYKDLTSQCLVKA